MQTSSSGAFTELTADRRLTTGLGVKSVYEPGIARIRPHDAEIATELSCAARRRGQDIVGPGQVSQAGQVPVVVPTDEG